MKREIQDYIDAQAKWVADNNIVEGTKLRATRTAELEEEG